LTCGFLPNVGAIGTVVFSALWACSGFGTALDVREQVLASYSEASNQREAAYATATAVFRRNEYDLRGTTRSSLRAEVTFDRVNFKASPTYALGERAGEFLGPKNASTIEVRNAQYSFTVAQKQDGSRAVSAIKMLPVNERIPLSPLHVPIADVLLRRTYLEILSDPAVEIVGVAERTWDGKACQELRVRFPFSLDTESRNMTMLVSYIFDPNVKWICRGRIFHAENEVEAPDFVDVYHYESVNDQTLPRLTKLEKFEMQGGTRRLVRDYVVEQFAPLQALDGSGFRLSAYGFEEPWGIIWPQPPTPWFLYFSAGGFGLFFLALFLWRVLAKRQARAGS
jgi:hypothetical protein